VGSGGERSVLIVRRSIQISGSDAEKEESLVDEATQSRFDNLSNLSGELGRVEGIYVQEITVELTNARNSVVGAVMGYSNSRLTLGRALRNYRLHFKADHSWVAAAKIIAAAFGCDERTVYRYIEDYERASQLPAITLEAMADQKIDPAAARNAGIVENLLQMPHPTTRAEASRPVATAHQKHLAGKMQHAKRTPSKLAEVSVEEFAAKIVRQFVNRYRSLAPQLRDSELQFVLELVINTLRSDIRELNMFDQQALVSKPKLNDAA
jgi:hypothetical protein